MGAGREGGAAGGGAVITICTDPTRCAALEHTHSDMADQLAGAWREVAQLKAQLVQAQTEAAEWREAYQGAVEGQAFYFAAYCDKCKEAR